MNKTNKNIEIIPAILPKSFEDLSFKIAAMRKLAKTVQIDAVDGKYAGKQAWPYYKADDINFLKLVKQEIGMPDWELIDTEVDLMVSDPRTEASKWIAAGVMRIVLHYKSAKPEIIEEIIKEAQDKGVEVAVSFELDQSIDEVKQILKDYYAKDIKLDAIQLMGIDEIGVQGEPFDHDVLKYISAIHKEYPDLIIAIDGGLKPEYARPIVDAGASRLIVGSAIYEAESPRDAYEHFVATIS